MKKYFSSISLVVMALAPIVSFAQNANGACSYQVTSIAIVFHLFGCILASAVIPLLVTLAVIVFIIGVIKYIANSEDSTKRAEGRNFMVYGIVALFVMVSIWGLVGILQGTFGLGTGIFIPQLSTS